MLRFVAQVLLWALPPRRFLTVTTVMVAAGSAAMRDARLDGWWTPPVAYALFVAALAVLVRVRGR